MTTTTNHPPILKPGTRGSVLRVREAGYAGGARFGVGHVGRNENARQVAGGPMVPGPWAYAYGLAAVLDNHGGSARESAEMTAAGTEHEVSIGDVVEIDGERYIITFAGTEARPDRHNLTLHHHGRAEARTLADGSRLYWSDEAGFYVRVSAEALAQADADRNQAAADTDAARPCAHHVGCPHDIDEGDFEGPDTTDDDAPCPCGASHTRSEHGYNPDNDERDPDDEPQELAESTAKEDARNRSFGEDLAEWGAQQVHLLIHGPDDPAHNDDEDQRREAVAWLLGNVSADPSLADRIATASGLLEA